MAALRAETPITSLSAVSVAESLYTEFWIRSADLNHKLAEIGKFGFRELQSFQAMSLRPHQIIN